MVSFIALDFETAHAQRWSPCAVGLAIVRNGRIEHAWDTYINPETPIAWRNWRIHGITDAMVQGAPTFPEVWREIEPHIRAGEAVVAHSASFDVGVLAATARRYRLQLPAFSVVCTRVFSRAWWPGWTSYALPDVVWELRLDEQLGAAHHHNARWDARACAAIATTGMNLLGASSWIEAGERSGVALGAAEGSGYSNCRRNRQARGLHPPPSLDRPAAIHDEAAAAPRSETSHQPLQGLAVCFTGVLHNVTRKKAVHLVEQAGGRTTGDVSCKTDLVVLGAADAHRFGTEHETNKMRKAREQIVKRGTLRVLTEADFLRMVRG